MCVRVDASLLSLVFHSVFAFSLAFCVLFAAIFVPVMSFGCCAVLLIVDVVGFLVASVSYD